MDQGRRNFLKLHAGFFLFSPLQFLSDSLCSISSRFCSNQSNHLDNYVLLHLAGAPARWFFDSPIQPTKEHKRVANNMIVNSFSDSSFASSKDISFSYQTTNAFGYEMPLMWEYPIDSSIGKNGELKQLLKNAHIVRGCRMGVDGHSINARKIVAPNPNLPSITGLISDRSEKAIAAIGMSGSHYPAHVTPLGGYRSEKTNSIFLIDKYSYSYFDDLFHSFLNAANSSKSNDEMIDLLLSQNSTLRESTHKKRNQARDLLKKNLNLLKEQYTERLNKYKIIIKNSSSRRDLKGLTDKRIPGFERERLNENDNQDNLNLFVLDDFFMGDSDLRDSLKSVDFLGLAQQFALTEFLLVNNLSSTICVDVPSPTNLNLINGYSIDHYDDKTNKLSTKTPLAKFHDAKAKSFTFDSHSSGLIAHHLFGTTFYYVFANCLTELTESLKASKIENQSVFDKTLIHISSEFDREPRPDMMGSEHGYNGQLNTFLSGAIKEFKIVGNIYDTNKGTPATYYDIGTWGEGAPMKFISDRPIVYGNIASSIASIMGVPTPTPNDRPLMNLKGGEIKFLTDELKNVIA